MEKNKMKKYKSLFEIEMQPTQEMIDFFHIRTNKHINLVRKYLDKIIPLNIFSDNSILEKEKVLHDVSKFKSPEYIPYLYVTWDYRMKDLGKESNLPDNIKNQMNIATEYHIKNNKHHPEYWSDKETNLINRNNRDKLPEELVDTTKMPLPYVACMVSDWMAMSDEKNSSPYDWVNSNINRRWMFNDNQVNLIYKLLDRCWSEKI